MDKTNAKIDLAGQNLSYEIKDGILVIAVDMAKNMGVSKSGKSTLIASSKGYIDLPGGAKINLNVYSPVVKA